MSYTTEKRTNPATIAAVVAVHAAIGYALISGLAMTVIREIPVVTLARFIPDPVPPPPEVQPQPQRATEAAPAMPRETIVDLPTLPAGPVVVPIPPVTVTILPPPEVRTAPPPPAGPVLTREASPRGDRAGWVTSDDYPPAALRDAIEGTTAIRVGIGTDGRVTGCTVTAGSGSDLLDQATCRVYARRARFAPALDGAGRPVAATRADRVTWRIPR